MSEHTKGEWREQPPSEEGWYWTWTKRHGVIMSHIRRSWDGTMLMRTYSAGHSERVRQPPLRVFRLWFSTPATAPLSPHPARAETGP